VEQKTQTTQKSAPNAEHPYTQLGLNANAITEDTKMNAASDFHAAVQ
jgi:hypothetical protein